MSGFESTLSEGDALRSRLSVVDRSGQQNKPNGILELECVVVNTHFLCSSPGESEPEVFMATI